MTEDQGVLTMKRSEFKRLQVISKVIRRELRQVEAAQVLTMSRRQLRRLVKRVREEGEHGIIHRLRGRVSARRIKADVHDKVLTLYREHYDGFGPTLAQEKLRERDGVVVSRETLRRWLIVEGLWQIKSGGGRRHLKWRERKAYFGEMVQMDGSHHDWLEGRGPWLVLMAQIDDATNRVSARFYDHEGTVPALDSLRRYVSKYGIPSTVYLDRHTTYKSNGKLTLQDELEGRRLMSCFERVCEKLGIEVIHAYSPQAKGRVERLFKTLQDRLVKELRLAKAKTPQEANDVLERFLVAFNRQFNVPAREATDMHRPVAGGDSLYDMFSVETPRTLRNDNTLVHHNRWFQVLSHVRTKEVLVQDRLNGKTYLLVNGRRVSYKAIAGPVKRLPVTSIPKARLSTRRIIPAQDHPWNQAARIRMAKKQKRPFLLCTKGDISTLR